MIPKSAIEKAIEEGWKSDFIASHKWLNGSYSHVGTTFTRALLYTKNGASVEICRLDQIPLDPTFWQALGKALEWSETYSSDYWTATALVFYDLILTGGDTEKFWEELLR